MRFATAVLVWAALGGSAAAQGAGAVVRAGRVLDVASGTYSTDVLVRIEDGKIASMARGWTGPLPPDAIDLGAYTVLPGLIDVHTHLCDNSYLGEDEWDWWALPVPAFGVVGAANAKRVLEAGFTTVRNVHEYYYCGVALRDAIERSWVAGPRIQASGPMITMTGGHGAPGNWLAPQHRVTSVVGAVADGPDAVRRQTRTHIKHGVDLIKVDATGGFASHGTMPGAATYTVDEMRAAVEEARKRGLFVAAHAHGDAGIRNAIDSGVRSIEHGSLVEDSTLALLRESGTYLVPDLLAARYDLVEAPRNWSEKARDSSGAEEYDRFAERVGRAHRAGVRIAFGTDSGVYPHGRNAEQLALLVDDSGLTPAEAIRTATVTAAELMGLEGLAGTLGVGSWADLIAVEGDPTAGVAPLLDVRFVMKGGVVVADTRPGPSPP